MIAAEKHNTSLLGIFYSYFHNIEGPKLAVEYPPNCISHDLFNRITDYIIMKDELCYQPMRVTVNDIEIIGFPVQISSPHYFRNAFNFNICFIVRKGEYKCYEGMVKKIALKFESLERESAFLQQPNIEMTMEGILKRIYESLKENNYCDFWIDSFTRILLFPTFEDDPQESELQMPKDYEVPFLRYPVQEIIRLLPDTILFEDLLHAIDGVKCVYQLQEELRMNEMQLKTCLVYLRQVTAVSFIDMFDICNIYVLEDYERIWDDALLAELLSYSRVHVLTQISYLENYHSRCRHGYSSEKLPDRIPDRMSEFVETNSERVELEDIRRLLSLFHINISLGQITQHPFFIRLKKLVDIHRFVVFACVHHLLRRVYIYPTITGDSHVFYTQFNSTLAPCSCIAHLNGAITASTSISISTPVVVEDVGMSMDGLNTLSGLKGVGEGVGEREKEVGGSSTKEADLHGMYRHLFDAFKYSLYHSSLEKSGISRHSSCLSFGKEILAATPCTCEVNIQEVKKLLDKHECLEYMALHLNCCIPAVIGMLETLRNVIYLKK